MGNRVESWKRQVGSKKPQNQSPKNLESSLEDLTKVHSGGDYARPFLKTHKSSLEKLSRKELGASRKGLVVRRKKPKPS